ncbi:MAG: hypothetical protein K2H31_09870, partial [Lachnospiraceae bacterium]|nr:hypothetical protein [Lachnospiraceae bacterium]
MEGGTTLCKRYLKQQRYLSAKCPFSLKSAKPDFRIRLMNEGYQYYENKLKSGGKINEVYY